MTEPAGIDMSDVADELNRDPLSKALFENAQLRVLTRKLNARVMELEAHMAGPADG